MSPRRSNEPSNYPAGPRSITLDLSELGWESLHSAIAVRITWFEHRIAEVWRDGDPDMLAKQLPWYEESLSRLQATLQSLEDQIDRDYYAKRRTKA